MENNLGELLVSKSNSLSCHIFDEDIEAIVSSHRTLQQSIMREFVCELIKKWSEQDYYDDRNKATVLLCKELMKTINESYLPFI